MLLMFSCNHLFDDGYLNIGVDNIVDTNINQVNDWGY